ncbi:hypothetical protein GQ42DRAFT_30022 [Ramicandelaber brevisporus]|nr:hypothetical protein GQ42DRAFT_30022 [Ramicandelaber brevisporus]
MEPNIDSLRRPSIVSLEPVISVHQPPSFASAVSDVHDGLGSDISSTTAALDLGFPTALPFDILVPKPLPPSSSSSVSGMISTGSRRGSAAMAAGGSVGGSGALALSPLPLPPLVSALLTATSLQHHTLTAGGGSGSNSSNNNSEQPPLLYRRRMSCSPVASSHLHQPQPHGGSALLPLRRGSLASSNSNSNSNSSGSCSGSYRSGAPYWIGGGPQNVSSSRRPSTASTNGLGSTLSDMRIGAAHLKRASSASPPAVCKSSSGLNSGTSSSSLVHQTPVEQQQQQQPQPSHLTVATTGLSVQYEEEHQPPQRVTLATSAQLVNSETVPGEEEQEQEQEQCQRCNSQASLASSNNCSFDWENQPRLPLVRQPARIVHNNSSSSSNNNSNSNDNNSSNSVNTSGDGNNNNNSNSGSNSNSNSNINNSATDLYHPALAQYTFTMSQTPMAAIHQAVPDTFSTAMSVLSNTTTTSPAFVPFEATFDTESRIYSPITPGTPSSNALLDLASSGPFASINGLRAHAIVGDILASQYQPQPVMALPMLTRSSTQATSSTLAASSTLTDTGIIPITESPEAEEPILPPRQPVGVAAGGLPLDPLLAASANLPTTSVPVRSSNSNTSGGAETQSRLRSASFPQRTSADRTHSHSSGRPLASIVMAIATGSAAPRRGSLSDTSPAEISMNGVAAVLKSRIPLAYFFASLLEAVCPESLLFYRASEHFTAVLAAARSCPCVRATTAAASEPTLFNTSGCSNAGHCRERVRDLAEDIYETFLRHNVPLELNVDQRARTAIQEYLAACPSADFNDQQVTKLPELAPPSMLSLARRQATETIADAYTRFATSRHYNKMVASLKYALPRGDGQDRARVDLARRIAARVVCEAAYAARRSSKCLARLASHTIPGTDELDDYGTTSHSMMHMAVNMFCETVLDVTVDCADLSSYSSFETEVPSETPQQHQQHQQQSTGFSKIQSRGLMASLMPALTSRARKQQQSAESDMQSIPASRQPSNRSNILAPLHVNTLGIPSSATNSEFSITGSMPPTPYTAAAPSHSVPLHNVSSNDSQNTSSSSKHTSIGNAFGGYISAKLRLASASVLASNAPSTSSSSSTSQINTRAFTAPGTNSPAPAIAAAVSNATTTTTTTATSSSLPTQSASAVSGYPFMCNEYSYFDMPFGCNGTDFWTSTPSVAATPAMAQLTPGATAGLATPFMPKRQRSSVSIDALVASGIINPNMYPEPLYSAAPSSSAHVHFAEPAAGTVTPIDYIAHSSSAASAIPTNDMGSSSAPTPAGSATPTAAASMAQGFRNKMSKWVRLGR